MKNIAKWTDSVTRRGARVTLACTVVIALSGGMPCNAEPFTWTTDWMFDRSSDIGSPPPPNPPIRTSEAGYTIVSDSDTSSTVRATASSKLVGAGSDIDTYVQFARSFTMDTGNRLFELSGELRWAMHGVPDFTREEVRYAVYLVRGEVPISALGLFPVNPGNVITELLFAGDPLGQGGILSFYDVFNSGIEDRASIVSLAGGPYTVYGRIYTYAAENVVVNPLIGSTSNAILQVNARYLPEPGSLALLALVLAGVGITNRKKVVAAH